MTLTSLEVAQAMHILTIALSLLLYAVAAPAADMLKAGDPFPTWELVDHRGQQVTSANFAGKMYLLWYYPKAMTAG